nr:GIY-YIG nuclease family protein [Bacteroidota bacterium]
MYAIVDIETTGGHASANGITEICILIHDGHKVIHRYDTLINPQISIPPFIQSYTNITNEMVSNAPVFGDVASDIFDLLHDKIFVAHSVNFDYTFIQHQLKQHGFTLNAAKLCTVRLSRKIFAGFPSYSLGNLCAQLGITVENRHRAGGDADATAILFSMLLQNDTEGHITQMKKKTNGEIYLPSHLNKEEFDKLPHSPGVYYFYDKDGKIIYIGKAKNLRKRVASHFSNNSPRKRKQDFIKNITNISFTLCTTELMAIILESIEIKQHWPQYNRALKFNEKTYGVYDYCDQAGVIRLGIDDLKKNTVPVMTSHNVGTLQLKLWELVKQYDLCPKYCGLLTAEQIGNHTCAGCTLSADEYNKTVNEAIDKLINTQATFVITEPVYLNNQTCVYMVDEGKFYGMGTLENNSSLQDKEQLKQFLTRYKSNAFVEGMLIRLAESMNCIVYEK